MPVAGSNKLFARVLIDNRALKVVDTGLCPDSLILSNEDAVQSLSSRPGYEIRVSGLGNITNDLRDKLREADLIRD